MPIPTRLPKRFAEYAVVRFDTRLKARPISCPGPIMMPAMMAKNAAPTSSIGTVKGKGFFRMTDVSVPKYTTSGLA